MFKYIVLGIVQGLTEFFPVSSSGHLVILQKILDIHKEVIALDIVLHLGTAFALLIFFFKEILTAFRSFKTISKIFITTVITGIIAVAGKDFFESLFSSPKLVASSLIITGIMLISTKKFALGKNKELSILDSVILGIAQGIAVIPGISRSGITISTLLFRKIDAATSFRSSFLVAIPVIFGAALWESKKIGHALEGQMAGFISGFVFSLLTGIFSLWLLKKILYRAKFHYFGYYCIIVAVLTLIFLK